MVVGEQKFARQDSYVKFEMGENVEDALVVIKIIVNYNLVLYPINYRQLIRILKRSRFRTAGPMLGQTWACTWIKA